MSERTDRADRRSTSAAGRRLEAELEALRQQNHELNEQIKLLTKGEQRLYRSQNELDRQLRRIEALRDFALRSTASGDPEEILREATVMLSRCFAADQVLALVQGEAGLELAASAPAELSPGAGRLMPPSKAIAACFSGLAGPLVLDRDDRLCEQVDVAGLIAWLDDADPCGCEGTCVDVALVPLWLGDGNPYGVLVIRSGRRQRSFHFEAPAESHRPFLMLLGTHIGRALDNVLLKRDLRERSAELAETNARLRSSLEDLARTQDQLLHAGKMEAIGRLAGGVAHDFNNLLTVILSYATILGEGSGAAAAPRTSRTGDERRPEIEQILAAAERASNLTRQLLTFSRREQVEPRILSVNDVVKDTAIMLRRLIGENITLELRLDPDIANVRADRGQLEQVIMNLAVNARDAMPSGGRLQITTRTVDPEELAGVDDAPAGPCVALELADTGHGIDEASRPRVFEPFFTTRTAGEGTGMGLAIVYGIVQQSGGCIRVVSEPGAGAAFRIDLPAVEGATVASAPVPPTPARRAGTATVLLVEDEEGIRHLGRRVLEAAGYEVVIAADGDEALARLRREDTPIDLLLTDVVMPRVGGVRLAAELRELRPGLRILFMSGYPGGAQGGWTDGPAQGYLRKPFTPRQLLDAVEAALDAAAEPPAVD